MTFVQLGRRFAEGAVHHSSALHGRSFEQPISPALYIFIVLHAEELGCAIGPALCKAAVPRKNRHIGDRVAAAGNVLVSGQTTVKYIELPLDLHGKTMNGVLDLSWCVGVEVAESTADIGRAAHLPKKPRQALCTRSRLLRQEAPELLCEIQQDRAGFEDPNWIGTAAVKKCWNLGVGIYRHEPAAELLSFVDANQPRVVFGAALTESQQLLQHHGNLHTVGCSQRIELQRVPAHG